MTKIHVSYPVGMSIHELQRKLSDLSLEGDYEFTYWDKRNYDNAFVSKASALLVVLPNNSWSMSTDTPEGIRREIREAVSLKREVYLLYTTKSGINNVYRTILTQKSGFYISGISGPVTKIEPCNGNPVSLNPCCEVELVPISKGYDKRVLLLLG